jgi:iron complex transport system substrate-binding protein
VRVVALETYLSEMTRALVGEGSLVGTVEKTHIQPDYETKLLTEQRYASKKNVLEKLSRHKIDIELLKETLPDCILTNLPEPELLPMLKEELSHAFGRPVALFHHDPVRLDDVFVMFEALGKQLKVPDKGRLIASKVKAQMMDWCANFYDRMKNKRVTLFSGVEPFSLGARWIPDMIRMTSAQPQVLSGLREDFLIEWNEVVKFNPDVIIVAPKQLEFKECLKLFPKLNELPDWEKIYAVKRGDVFFTDGRRYFNTPTTKLIESMGILISCLAGFESGYITERDSSFKLRYLEMHRHKFL